MANPHQRIGKYAGNTEQNKELTAAKALTEPGIAKVIGQITHQRADNGIQHPGHGENEGRLNRR